MSKAYPDDRDRGESTHLFNILQVNHNVAVGKKLCVLLMRLQRVSPSDTIRHYEKI